MKKLLNTLYVLSDDVYLSLDGENIVILRENDKVGQFPLHTLENILCFSYKGASPALMGKCANVEIGLAFFTPTGRFLSRVCGESRGNVLLRKEQYRRSDDIQKSCEISRAMILGKVYNCRWVLERATRDHAMRIDVEAVKHASGILVQSLKTIADCKDMEVLRGLEGEAAAVYFGVINNLILHGKDEFAFAGRSRRPPLDKINALLSFVYTLLSHWCANALEGVGLDSYVGFLHRDRPGRKSAALDLMEELRPVLADRFVISLINTRQIRPEHFESRENGAVLLDENGRKIVLSAWQERRKEQIVHPFLEEKIMWGLVPHVQSQLLSRYLRGDLEAYPPFLWK